MKKAFYSKGNKGLAENPVKIVYIDKGRLDIEYHGRLVRAWGDMCDHGFAAAAESLEWVGEGEGEKLSETQRKLFIKEVDEYCKIKRRELGRFKMLWSSGGKS